MDPRLLLRLWHALKADSDTRSMLDILRPITAKALGWMLFAELLVVLMAYPLKALIDLVSRPDDLYLGGRLSQEQYFVATLVGAGCLYTLQGLAKYRVDVTRNSALWLFYIAINSHGQRKQLSLGADWHVANSGGEKESLLSKNHKKVDNTLDYFVFAILPLTFRMLLGIIGTFILGWQFGLLAVGTVGIYILTAARTERKVAPMRADYRRHTKAIDISDSVLTGMALTIRELGLEQEFLAAHNERLMTHWYTEVPRSRRFYSYIWGQDQVITLGRLSFMGLAYVSGYSAGSIVLANAWLEQTCSNLWRIGEFQAILNEGAEALRELVEVFETEPTLLPPECPQWPEHVRGAVTFKDVTFQYPGAATPALSNVSLEVTPGMTVALVGPSGGGKSTWAKLLQRQYDPQRGRIYIDGVPLDQIDDVAYRKHLIGVVSQEPSLFDQTVAENIEQGRLGALVEEICAAADKAGALPFIERLLDGFETLIGERGVKLSGGQRQRLALARALVRRPPILILDEPTSALDAETQLDVTRSLRKLTEERASTVFIIAHRFSTIEMADLVVVMEDGRISEIGTHEQLARRNGLYTRLRQLEGLTD